jgi:GGDEF domain-containing protein
VGAVHRGRKGGLVTAIIAILAYVGMRVPLITRHGFSSDVAGLLLVRTLTYGIIGIGGGILCSRIHQFLARLEGTSNIDTLSQVFNERYIVRTLRSLLLQYQRYGKTFSLVIVSLAGHTLSDPGPDRRRSLRAAAKYLRDHVRLVDEVARLDDGRFVLVMPHTDKRGARIAADRICGGLKRLLGARDESVSESILGAEEDLTAIQELCGAPETAADARTPQAA